MTHRDGSTESLQSRARVSGVTKLVQSRTYMGDDKVTIEVNSAHPIAFNIGDRIDIHGEPYTLNRMPTARKTGERAYTYTLELESMQYQLVSTQFLLFDNLTDDMVANPSQHTLTGLMLNSLTGTAQDILKMIVLNANRTAGDGKWQVGTCPENTDTINFTLDRGTCLEALQQMCEDWKLEFAIFTDATTGVNTINLAREPEIIPSAQYTFNFGKVGGLATLERAAKEDDIVTRLYAYGGTQNIPNEYLTEANTNRLCIRQEGGTRKKHLSYVENATLKAQYGTREAVATYDDIYPRRTGKVSGIYTEGDTPERKFRDSSMFDLNERNTETGETLWLIPGTTAKVVFQTGQLSGYTFDITDYDHNTRTFTIAELKEEGDIVLPSPDNTTLRIAVNDTYILTDIRMPSEYVTAAEDELKTKAAQTLAQTNADMYRYTIEVDSRWTKIHAGDWGRQAEQPYIPGDFVAIIDHDLGINILLRLTSLTHDIIADKYTLTVERFFPRPKTRQTAYRSNIIATEDARRTHLNVVASHNIASSAMITSMVALESAQAAQTEIDTIIPFIPTPQNT